MTSKVRQTAEAKMAAASVAAAKEAAPVMLLGRVKDIILKMEIMGDDTPEDLAEFMSKNLEILGKASNDTYKAPERNLVLRWLEANQPDDARGRYLTFTEHLNNVAVNFADICKIVRPVVEKEKTEGAEVTQAEVISRALELTKKACAEILTEQKVAAPARQ